MSAPASLAARYAADGFYSPVDVLSREEARAAYSQYQQYVERYGVGGSLQGDTRFRVHLVASWAARLVRHPALVAAVTAALQCPDLLCWSSDLCVKEAESPLHTTWHQDSTYSGLQPPHSMVTAWLALSPAPLAAGCLELLPGSHHHQLPHTELRAADNMLSLGQAVTTAALAPLLSSRVPAPLEPGQASLHSWQCVHSSGPNTTQQDRVGLAVRFMAAGVVNTKAGLGKERASLVCGSPGSNWDIEWEPKVDYGREEWEQHRESMRIERNNYFAGKEVQQFK